MLTGADPQESEAVLLLRNMLANLASSGVRNFTLDQIHAAALQAATSQNLPSQLEISRCIGDSISRNPLTPQEISSSKAIVVVLGRTTLRRLKKDSVNMLFGTVPLGMPIKFTLDICFEAFLELCRSWAFSRTNYAPMMLHRKLDGVSNYLVEKTKHFIIHPLYRQTHRQPSSVVIEEIHDEESSANPSPSI